MTKLFFDTEFTGLHKDTTLISIGIISEDEKKFYAEFSDMDEKQCDLWVKENVLKHTILFGDKKENQNMESADDYNLTVVFGNKNTVKNKLAEWLKQFSEVQLISDVCHYDMVLFIDIFGSAFDLPENVSASCHDINQDIASWYGISEKEAFNKSREDIIGRFETRRMKYTKHNALYDAEVIKSIYEKIGQHE